MIKITISPELFDELINHLEVHSPTDAWARALLSQLKKEGKKTISSDLEEQPITMTPQPEKN